ncbi:MAG: glycosyltransferase family 39 protein [Planctomycetota bacterium]
MNNFISPSANRNKITRAAPEIALFLAAAVLLLAGLSRSSIQGSHEDMIAEPAHEAAVNGHWWILVYKGKPRLQKPPLANWAVAASYIVTGRENAFTTHLPSAILALAGIGVAYLFGRKLYGRTGGLIFGLCLATMPFFLFLAARPTTDAYLAFFVFLCFYLFYLFCANGSRAALFGFYAALAAAFMSKGPVAVAIVVPAAALFLLLTRRFSLLKNRRHIWGALLFLALAMPWPVSVALTVPDAARIWLREGFSRYGSALHGHSRSVYFYAKFVPLFTLPWLPFLVTGAINFRRWFAPPRRDGIAFFLTWLVWGFTFFSLCDEKKVNYILPLAAPVAMIAAGYCAHILINGAGKALRAVLLVTAVFFAATGIGVAAFALSHFKISAKVACGGGWAAVTGVCIVCGVWLFISALKRLYVSSVAAIAAGGAGCYLVGVLIYLPNA